MDVEMQFGTNSSLPSSIDTVKLLALNNSADAMDCSEDEVELESFSSLRPKVLALVAQLFPNIEELGKVFVEDVRAGTYNRVIGVTLPSARNCRCAAARSISTLSNHLGFSQAEGVQARRGGAQFAVRIPMDERKEDEDLVHEISANIAILEVVGSRLAVPIPKIFKHGFDTTNPIGQPYVLQGRLLGRNCDCCVVAMNNRQLASAVVEITRIIEKIAAVTSHHVGCISLENINSSVSDPLIIDQFSPAMPFHGPRPKAGSALPQSPVEFLKHCCQRWRA